MIYGDDAITLHLINWLRDQSSGTVTAEAARPSRPKLSRFRFCGSPHVPQATFEALHVFEVRDEFEL